MIQLYHQIVLYDFKEIFWNEFLNWIYNKVIGIDDQIKDEKIKFDINRAAAKYQPDHQAKLINMNILQTKKYCHLIKNK